MNKFAILGYTNVVITVITAPTWFDAFNIAIGNYGHYCNVYTVQLQ